MVKQKVVEVETKRRRWGPEHVELHVPRELLPCGLYILKRDGNHWKRDFKAKSELPFNNNIQVILCVKKEDYLEILLQ